MAAQRPTPAALAALAVDIRDAGLTRYEVECIIYELSPAERRLFLRLCRGPADTIELRTTCSVGNISEVAIRANHKFAAAGDGRRIVCRVREHVNQFGERGKLGEWKVVRGGDEQLAAA